MRVDVILEYLPLYLKAALLSAGIGLSSIILAILIGMIASMILYYRIPFLKRIISFYVEVSRNTPLMIQLFFIYYGLPKIGIATSPLACGIVGLSFLGGGYMCESIRGGLESISESQVESAMALGMNKKQTMRYVIVPQALRASLSGLVANMIFMLKETSVLSAVSLMDLMFTAKDLIGLYYKTTEALFLLVVFYLLILTPVILLGHLAERRLTYGKMGV